MRAIVSKLICCRATVIDVMMNATPKAPAVGRFSTHVQALSSSQRLALHRRYICAFKALVSHKPRHNQQKLNAAPKPDSALQRIVASRRGKTGSAALNRLSKPELQQELRSRGLSDRGLKDELKTRLLDSLDIDPPTTEIASEPPHATQQPGSSPAGLTTNTQGRVQPEGTEVTEEEHVTSEEYVRHQEVQMARRWHAAFNECECLVDNLAKRSRDKADLERQEDQRNRSTSTFKNFSAENLSNALPEAAAAAAQASTAAPAAQPAATSRPAPAAASQATIAPAALAAAEALKAAASPPAAVQGPTAAASATAQPLAAAAAAAAAAVVSDTASAEALSAPTPATMSTGSPAAPGCPNMSVTWLGTSSGAPSLRRNVSCMALTFGSDTYLVDCGEGSAKQVLRAKINPRSIKGIFISHLHGDHCFGLPGLIEMISQSRADDSEADADPELVAHREPVRVFGPPGIQQLVKAANMAGNTRLTMPLLVTDFTLDRQQARPPTPVDPSGLISFARLAPQQTAGQGSARQNPQSQNRHRGQQAKLQAHDVPVIPGLTWTMKCGNGLTVRAAQLQHRLPCWGYVIEEARTQQLPGRKVVLLGDTCHSEAIAGLGMGADLLAHEATFAAGMENKAHKAQHSTAPMAGEFARKIRANALVLTHFSNRYSSRGPRDEVRGESDNDHKDVLQQLISQARGAFGKDRVWAAYDFYTFDIRHKHKTKPSTY